MSVIAEDKYWQHPLLEEGFTVSYSVKSQDGREGMAAPGAVTLYPQPGSRESEMPVLTSISFQWKLHFIYVRVSLCAHMCVHEHPRKAEEF